MSDPEAASASPPGHGDSSTDRTQPGGRERLTLSQELSQFLLEFSIALSRMSMYPAGHPSLDWAASGVIGRLAALLADRTSISIGVARRQLVIEGVATDPTHPVLRSLAEKLHRHHLGAVVFLRGVHTEELVGMLRLIGAEPEREGPPLGLGNPDVLKQWRSVRLYPVTYEQLELVDAEGEDASQRGSATRSAQLWIGLATAALASEESVPAESTEPAVVAKAINEHPAAKAYDQVIVGYLLQLADELKKEGGAASAAVRRRLSRLIGGLDRTTLIRLVEMGGDLEQRRQFVMDASEALAVDAVVDLVLAAAATNDQSISKSMVRLLSKMSAFAEQSPQRMRVQADTSLREQVQRLMQDWTLDNPNPDAYTRALETLSSRPTAPDASRTTRHAPEPLRIVQMALELDAVGLPFWRAVDEVMRSQGVAPLIEALDLAGDTNLAAAGLWDRLASVRHVQQLLNQDIVDLQSLGRLIDRIPPAEVAPVLMETLVESPVRATRFAVFKRLASFELAVLEPLIMKRLSDERWYVRRNMLALLNEKRAFSEVVLPETVEHHPDARVRREALQLYLRSPHHRDNAVCTALSDPDDRAFRAGILEASRGCPEPAVPIVLKRLEEEDMPPDLRAQLLRLLHGVRSTNALEALLRVATKGRSLFGQPRLARSSPPMLAALSVLSSTWAADSRAARVLKLAASAPEMDVRTAAEGSRRR